jgi:hypothetical protein
VSKSQCVENFTGANSAKGDMKGKVANIGRQEHTKIDIKIVANLSWSTPNDEKSERGHAACIVLC